MLATSNQPVIPAVTPVSLEEAVGLINRGGSSLKNYESSPILAISLLGSCLYGLQTPESDRDVFVLTGCDTKRDVQVIFDEGADVRVASLGKFTREVMASSPPKVDLLRSGGLQVLNKNWVPHFDSMRFSPLQYVDSVESHSLDELARCMSFEGAPSAKAVKQLKIALRNLIMSYRVRQYGNSFSPLFSLAQREVYYDQVARLDELRQSGYSARELFNVMGNMGRLALERG